MLDEARRGHYDKARKKLDEWEDHYGATDASRALRDQLPDGDVGPPGKRKHKRED